MITLGIDPGTRVTGFGIILREGTTYRALDYGCIRPPPSYSLPDRYLVIFEGVDALIEKYHPHSLAVETQYVKNNVQSAMKLGMARGAVLIAAARKGIAIHEYAPSKAKLAVTGTGRASKQQVQGMMQRLLSLASLPTPEDAADALALAFCHAQNQREICTVL